MKSISNCIFILVLLLPILALGQSTDEEKIDSLQEIIKSNVHDSIRIEAYKEWDGLIYRANPKLDYKINQIIDSIADVNLQKDITPQERQYFLMQKSVVTNIFGVIAKQRGEYFKAIQFYNKALELSQRLKNDKGISTAYNNLALVYHDQGLYNKAIEFHTKSLKIKEKTGDKKGVALSLNNIGVIYKDQEELDLALESYARSLKIYEEIDNKIGIVSVLNNLGNIERLKKNYQNALKYYFKCLRIEEKIDYQKGIAASYTNIGDIYMSANQLDSALYYIQKSIEIKEKFDNQKSISSSYNSIGNIYFKKGATKKAIFYCEKAMKIAQEIGSVVEIQSAAESLWDIYRSTNNSRKALEAYEIYNKMKDQIFSKENRKKLIQHEFKYQYQKKATEDSVKAAELSKQKDAAIATEKAKTAQIQLEKKNQQQLKYFLFGGITIALIFGGFIFNRLRIARKQKNIIQKQKKEVDYAYGKLDVKNSEILDSIAYAKRIQTAILPPDSSIRTHLPDSFVFYKPKDIVAGDFYWIEPCENKVLLAAADCTGHGVPGAMVSVVCNNALNRSVREFGLTDPGKILDQTRNLVIKEFEKSEEEVKDGMDIALISLQKSAQSERDASTPLSARTHTPHSHSTLSYAGAHNPLWIIRKEGKEVEEIKANKQPIGKFERSTPFTTHEVQLNAGDTFYIFSDGFADQFGGEKNKKFKSKNLKKLLLSIQNKTMDQQKAEITKVFDQWKGDFEQLDDVCLIGVKV